MKRLLLALSTVVLLVPGCAPVPAAVPAPRGTVIAEATFDLSPRSAHGMPDASTLSRALADVPPPGFGPKDISSTASGSRFAIAASGTTEYQALDRCWAISRAVTAPPNDTSYAGARGEAIEMRDSLFVRLDAIDRSLKEIALDEEANAGPVALALPLARVEAQLLERRPLDLRDDSPVMLRLAADRELKARTAILALGPLGLGQNHPDVVLATAEANAAAAALAAQLEEERRWARNKILALEKAPKKGSDRDTRLALLRLLADELERPSPRSDGAIPSSFPLRLRLLAREVQLRHAAHHALDAGLGPKHPDRVVARAKLDEAVRVFEEERKLVAAEVREFADRGIVEMPTQLDDRPKRRAEVERELAGIIQHLRKLDQAAEANRQRGKVEVPCHIKKSERAPKGAR